MEGVTSMTYVYQMVCLANSKKPGGRCVAGKISTGQYQNYWIRPVAPRANRTITLDDQAYEDGEHPSLLDVINITYSDRQAQTFQQENHIIHDTEWWELVGQFDTRNLHTLVDTPQSLWETTNDDSYSGLNDRIPARNLVDARPSLFLIRPERVRIKVSSEGAYRGDNRLMVRAFFTYNRISYGLKVTDLVFESKYQRRGAGEYDAENILYFTVSLGEVDERGYGYKLVAAVFEE
jgi:hypothetical protein